MDFVDRSGENVIEAWFAGLIGGAEEHINAKLWRLATLQKTQWNPKWISKYKTSDSIYEIRCPFNDKQYRPLGYFGPNRLQFTLLVGAIEIGGKIADNLIAKAEGRKATLEKDHTRVCKHYFVQGRDPQ